MMMMTVLKVEKDGSTTLESINLLDVHYVEIEGRKIVYHVDGQKYRHISTLSELEDHLACEGFDMLDKTNLVNLNKVKLFDEKQGKVFFKDPVDDQSNFATVAFIKQRRMRMIRTNDQSSSPLQDLISTLRIQ